MLRAHVSSGETRGALAPLQVLVQSPHPVPDCLSAPFPFPQVVGVLSRTMATMMQLLPPRFSNDVSALGDEEAGRRCAVKPQTIVDALYLAQKDVLLGFAAGAFGLAHDPAAGEGMGHLLRTHRRIGVRCSTPQFY